MERCRAARWSVQAVAALVLVSSTVAVSPAWAGEPGSQLWVARYSPPEVGDVDATAVSPDGSLVFVTGHESGSGTIPAFTPDFVTVAYEASTGQEVWTSRFDSGGASRDEPAGVAVSPDSSIVFVTGHSKGRGTFDYVTIAYDASNGNAIWRKRFDGGRNDYAVSIVASPDGANVYVTGFSRKPGQRADYLTVAMDVVTGKVTWHKRYNGPNDLWDTPSALVISPDSQRSSSRAPSKVRFPTPTSPRSPTTRRQVRAAG